MKNKKIIFFFIPILLIISGCQAITNNTKQVRKSFDNSVQYSTNKANQIKDSVYNFKKGVNQTVDNVNQQVKQVKDVGNKINQTTQAISNITK